MKGDDLDIEPADLQHFKVDQVLLLSAVIIDAALLIGIVPLSANAGQLP